MDCDVVEINCWCFFDINYSLYRHRSNFDGYKCTRYYDGSIVEFKIGGENIRINFTNHFKENIHVGVIGCIMHRSKILIEWPMSCSKMFSDECREDARWFFLRHPTVPIIIVCSHAEWKCDPNLMKETELEGNELMVREIGDKLARELGAVKYIEYSEETGRGAKILFDEIAFAGIGKIRDDEKRRNKRQRCVVT